MAMARDVKGQKARIRVRVRAVVVLYS